MRGMKLGAATVAVVAGLGLPPAAAETDLDRAAVEAIVRDYLMREPQVIIEAIEAFRAQQEEARQAAMTAALLAHSGALTAADHPSAGPADAVVTMVEFFDYRCSFCRRMAPTVDGVAEANPDVRRVFIEFPVLGPESLRAAQAALAVWMEDPAAYPAFHLALMQSEDLSAPALMALADEAGIDGERMVSRMQSAEVRERLQRNYELAQAVGIEGTPAYVIGDRLLPGAVPAQQLQAALDDARAGSEAPR
jgi:protein-disulfide isomerase